MKIGLYNLEPKYKNLALEKLRMYYRQSGDTVGDCSPVEGNGYDLVYCSSIFDYTKKDYVTPNMIAGGTGFDIRSKLPSDVEDMQPRLNFGFTTRGCFRGCPFCVAWIKEGLKVSVIGDLYSLWDGKNRLIKILDNNILAVPEHFELICRQAQENNLILDFNQGLDIRLVTERLAKVMAATKMSRIRFAFDSPLLEDIIREKVSLLRSIPEFERRDFFFYVLMGYEGNIRDDLHRLNILKELNCRAYGMRHKNMPRDRHRSEVIRWANLPWAFMKYTFAEFYKLRTTGSIG